MQGKGNEWVNQGDTRGSFVVAAQKVIKSKQKFCSYTVVLAGQKQFLTTICFPLPPGPHTDFCLFVWKTGRRRKMENVLYTSTLIANSHSEWKGTARSVLPHYIWKWIWVATCGLAGIRTTRSRYACMRSPRWSQKNNHNSRKRFLFSVFPFDA